jgi:tRNA threonylcarbamoyladenosine biosynthesis protein TsaE
MKKTICNLEELDAFAGELAKKAAANACLLLDGDLGAGKTTLTKRILHHLGVQENVASPTFVILNQYETPQLKINHMDAYRLDYNEDIEQFAEQFDGAFNVIEWSKNLNFAFSGFKIIKIQIKMIDDNCREFGVE